MRLVVQINYIEDVPVVINQSKTAPCIFNEIIYSTLSGMSNYVWTVIGGNIIGGGLTSDNFVTVAWINEGQGSVGVSYTNSCNQSNSKTIDVSVVVCSDLTITKTVSNATPMHDENIIFTIKVNNVGVTPMQNIVVDELIPSGYSFISATATTGLYSNVSGIWDIPLLDENQIATLSVVVKVLSNGNYTNVAQIVISDPIDMDLDNNIAEASTEPLCLTIYNEFSPNDDGSNDVFVIDCIESYPNNKLDVFNRYGILVYSKNKYLNDWDGTANVSGTVKINDKLPAGTYYYILDLGANNGKKNGWLSIAR